MEGVKGSSDGRNFQKRKEMKKTIRKKKKETGENGEALQTEMNAMDCSQQENDRKEGRETARGRESIRERGGSRSVMVSHSRTAAKEKRQRGRATRRTREINTTGGGLRRSCSLKKAEKGKR